MERINPFAFPFHHTLLFLVLIVTLLLPTISESTLYAKSFMIARTISAPISAQIIFLSFPLIFLCFPLLTFFFYLLDPQKKIKKQNLQNMETVYPEVALRISRLSEQIGVRSPMVLWADSPIYQAEVFGNARNIYMKITDGLSEAFLENSKLIEPIILHELSHLKNRDLVKHTIAEKMMKSYLILLCIHAVLFIIARFFVSETFFQFHSSFLQDLYLIPIVTIYLLNGQLLRVRELYADARAASVQKTTGNLITVLRFFASGRGWLDRIKGHPTAMDRVNALEDNTALFTPRIEYGLVFGLLLGYYEEGVGLNLISPFNLSYLDFLPGIMLISTGFILFSVLFLPYQFIVAIKGLKMLAQPIVFLVGLALGFMAYRIYAQRLVIALIQASVLHIVFITAFWFTAVFCLQFALTMLLFTHSSPSKNRKFMLLELISLVPFVLALITLQLLFIPILVYATVLLILYKQKSLGKCPNCGAKLRDTKDIFMCPACSYKMNEWVFEDL